MKTDWKDFLIDTGAEFEDGLVMHYGNPERECEVSLSGMVFCDLSHLGVIAVYGKDAAGFLQSQLSNDVSRIDDDTHQLAAYCTPKGRVIGLFRLFRQGDTFYLRLPADTLEAVLQRLRLFVLRADVTLEDASENFVRIGISGEAAGDELLSAAGKLPEQSHQAVHTDSLTLLRVPGIEPCYEVYAGSIEAAKKLWEALNVRAAAVGMAAWRLLQIQAGIPDIYAATTDLFVPQMLNLQLINGVDFKKGCYPGQEIVARTQYLGKLKRRMYLGYVESATQPQPGDSLYSASDSAQAAGRIVDAQPHPDGGFSALAVLQISAADADELRFGASDGPAFSLRSLPYPFEPDK
ncbi:MAG: folate-binding protein [Gammaproteobacteria bacterium]|nr:folate-binding protein [Gammaproteobacteria bacterium]